MNWSISDLFSGLFLKIRNKFLPWLVVEKYFLTCKKTIFYEHDLSSSIFQKSKIEINLRKADLSDLKRLAELRANEKSPSEHRVNPRKYLNTVLKRLKAGHCCFIAEKNNESLGYVWIAFHKLYIVELERKLLLNDKSTLFYDLYTFSSYRGLGVAPKLIEHAFSYLKNNNFEKAYIMVDQHNKSSRAATEKNFRQIDVILYMKYFGYSYVSHLLAYPNLRLVKAK